MYSIFELIQLYHENNVKIMELYKKINREPLFCTQFENKKSVQFCMVSHLWGSMKEKSVALERKVVLVIVWESRETHVRHWLTWYDLSC